MEWHAITLQKMATIRTADNGIANNEWQHGARIVRYEKNLNSKPELVEYLNSLKFEILNREEWKEYLFNPNNIQNDTYISTKKVWDKWDRETPIY